MKQLLLYASFTSTMYFWNGKQWLNDQPHLSMNLLDAAISPSVSQVA
ncbi:MAG: hypothetical protein ACP5OR_08420 [Candidatus Dormibacteria bacterium]